MDDVELDAQCVFENSGDGHALHARWNFLKDRYDDEQPLGAFPRGHDFVLLHKNTQKVVEVRTVFARGVVITFEDTAGIKYWHKILGDEDFNVFITTGQGEAGFL